MFLSPFELIILIMSEEKKKDKLAEEYDKANSNTKSL